MTEPTAPVDATTEPDVVPDHVKKIIRPGVWFFINDGEKYNAGREYIVTYVTDTVVSHMVLEDLQRKDKFPTWSAGAHWKAFEKWVDNGQINVSGETPGYVHKIPHPTYNSLNGIETPGIVYLRPTWEHPEVTNWWP